MIWNSEYVVRESPELTMVNSLAKASDPLIKCNFTSTAMIISEFQEVNLPDFDMAYLIRFKYLNSALDRLRFIGIVGIETEESNEVLDFDRMSEEMIVDSVASFMDEFRYQVLDVEYCNPDKTLEENKEEFLKLIGGIERKV